MLKHCTLVEYDDAPERQINLMQEEEQAHEVLQVKGQKFISNERGDAYIPMDGLEEKKVFTPPSRAQQPKGGEELEKNKRSVIVYKRTVLAKVSERMEHISRAKMVILKGTFAIPLVFSRS